jgi:hypothetical protein
MGDPLLVKEIIRADVISVLQAHIWCVVTRPHENGWENAPRVPNPDRFQIPRVAMLTSSQRTLSMLQYSRKAFIKDGFAGASVKGPRKMWPREAPTMTTFDDRENAFEAKFARDENLRFTATARRNRYLGVWAAEKLGLSGPDADAYVKDVIAKVLTDFKAKGVPVDDKELRRKLLELTGQALAEIEAGK